MSILEILSIIALSLGILIMIGCITQSVLRLIEILKGGEQRGDAMKKVFKYIGWSLLLIVLGVLAIVPILNVLLIGGIVAVSEYLEN